jgi:hypothetical protein
MCGWDASAPCYRFKRGTSSHDEPTAFESGVAPAKRDCRCSMTQAPPIDPPKGTIYAIFFGGWGSSCFARIVCGEEAARDKRDASVSQVFKSIGHTTPYDPPIWKSAIQQVWKPALRFQMIQATAGTAKKRLRKAFDRLARCPCTKVSRFGGQHIDIDAKWRQVQ